MIRVTIQFVVSIALTPALYAFIYEGLAFLAGVLRFEDVLWFVGGMVLFLLAYVVFLHGNIDFIESLLHELEHAVVYFLRTFKWPTRMEIDPEKGSKVVVVDKGCFLLLLAPYYFPLLTVPFLVLKPLLRFTVWRETSLPTFVGGPLDLAIGATLLFHGVCTCKEFRPSQTDVKKTGRIASFIAVVFLNFVFVVVSLAVVTEAYAELWDYLKATPPATKAAYQTVLDFIETHVVPVVTHWIQNLKDLFCVYCTPTPTP